MAKVSKDDIICTLKDGVHLLGVLAMRLYGESLNQVGEEAFSDAIQQGIENTIACLYAANVDDKTIIHVVSEQWGLKISEIEDRIVWEKEKATLQALKQYLRLQGYSDLEIEQFMKASNAGIKIRHEHELLRLKEAPQKLMEAIQKSEWR